MATWDGLTTGFSIVFTTGPLLFGFLGVLLGTLVGIMPGLGPMGACALLLPMTYHLEPATALIMLCGIYYGAMYGGSTTSILLNIPGESASVVTCIDGHQMALKGRAGPALAIAAIGSFVAGTMGVILLTFVSVPLAKAALRFGPPEYFAIGLVGLLLLSRLSSEAPLKSYVTMCIGVAISTVGIDPISGFPRFADTVPKLAEGIDFIPVVMGLYGIAEVFLNLRLSSDAGSLRSLRMRDLFLTKQDLRDSAGPVCRGGLLGFLVGLIPGPAAVISTFVSYWVERRISKKPEEFGKGAIAGVAGPESANNGAATGNLLPLLALGVPFSPMPALLLAGFMIHGVFPGPLLMKDHPDIFWAIIASMYVGNAMLLVLNLPLAGLFARVALIPPRIMMPLVTVFCFLGAFAVRNSLFDMYLVLVFGIIGYLFRREGYDPAPLALGMILGPMLENSLRQSMVMFTGDYLEFFSRPLSGTLTGVALVVLLSPGFNLLLSRMKRAS